MAAPLIRDRLFMKIIWHKNYLQQPYRSRPKNFADKPSVSQRGFSFTFSKNPSCSNRIKVKHGNLLFYNRDVNTGNTRLHNQESTSKCRGSQKGSTNSEFASSKSRSICLKAATLTAVAAVGAFSISVFSSVVDNEWGLKTFKKVYAKDGERPTFTPSRKVQVATDASGLKLMLFQYQTCPFCCKVRAVLDYHGFSYDVIEVNSVTKKQLKWTEYKKVPILIVQLPGSKNEVKIVDSSVIISVLESYLHDRSTGLEKYSSYYPCITENEGRKTKYDFPNKYFIMFQETADLSSTPDQRKEERKWREWADDHLVHMLSPNAYRTPRESLQAFKYFSEVGEWEQNFSTLERQVVIYVGATVMYFIGKILKTKYKLKEDVRQSLYDACNEWVKAVGKDRPFMGGNQPNLADLAVYGVLNSIEGCEAFHDALHNTKLEPWYNRTKKSVMMHEGAHPLNTKALPSNFPKQK
ncbi:prostaglandin E synthase 2-like [Physella acuta]|uniref:prostaglandin E synthase 2-like n=1 Tax=Physella acuta TaxID=109671 RepID=UPI0027DE8459|nr:prostaglandin E synthase 2-like [Physella acuta]